MRSWAVLAALLLLPGLARGASEDAICVLCRAEGCATKASLRDRPWCGKGPDPLAPPRLDPDLKRTPQPQKAKISDERSDGDVVPAPRPKPDDRARDPTGTRVGAGTGQPAPSDESAHSLRPDSQLPPQVLDTPLRAGQLPARRRALRTGGFIASAAGLLAIGAGAVLLGVNGRQSCALPPEQTQCPERLATTSAGGALLGLGAAALIPGGLMLGLGYRSDGQRPVAWLTIGGRL